MIHYTQFVNMARKIATQYKTLWECSLPLNNPHSFQDATQGGVT